MLCVALGGAGRQLSAAAHYTTKAWFGHWQWPTTASSPAGGHAEYVQYSKPQAVASARAVTGGGQQPGSPAGGLPSIGSCVLRPLAAA